jgi:Putative peptidoglycan binding domain
MILRLGNSGAAVRTLQQDLNKIGSLLLIDGQFGPGTKDAVVDARSSLAAPGPPEADDALQASLAALPDLFPSLTTAGTTFIARAEISSAGAYRAKYKSPCWPGAASGITIGIGYDCQFVSPEEFRADWANVVPDVVVDALVPTIGRVGNPQLLSQVSGVAIPLPTAMTVFANRTLPKYLNQTRSIYPQLDGLSAARRTALVSLVYNRGTRLDDHDRTLRDRLEMRTIQALLAAGDPDPVADQLESMARLWDQATAAGLVLRRRAEATLWRDGFSAVQLA